MFGVVFDDDADAFWVFFGCFVDGPDGEPDMFVGCFVVAVSDDVAERLVDGECDL